MGQGCMGPSLGASAWGCLSSACTPACELWGPPSLPSPPSPLHSHGHVQCLAGPWTQAWSGTWSGVRDTLSLSSWAGHASGQPPLTPWRWLVGGHRRRHLSTLGQETPGRQSHQVPGSCPVLDGGESSQLSGCQTGTCPHHRVGPYLYPGWGVPVPRRTPSELLLQAVFLGLPLLAGLRQRPR